MGCVETGERLVPLLHAHGKFRLDGKDDIAQVDSAIFCGKSQKGGRDEDDRKELRITVFYPGDRGRRARSAKGRKTSFVLFRERPGRGFSRKSSTYVVAVVDTSDEAGPPDYWRTTHYGYVVCRDPAGRYTNPSIVDTMQDVSFGLGGNGEDLLFDAAEDPQGGFIVALSRRSIVWTDVWPNCIPVNAAITCKRISEGIAKTIFSEDSADDARMVLDQAGTIHVVYESLITPDSSPPWNHLLHARSTILHKSFPSTSPVDASQLAADTIGRGFDPHPAIDEHGTVYVAWFRCESTFSPAGAVMLSRVDSGRVTSILVDSVHSAVPWLTNVGFLPQIRFTLDVQRTAWISWVPTMGDSSLFVARVDDQNQVLVDSLALAASAVSDFDLNTDSSGTAYVAWSSNNVLFESSCIQTGRMFQTIRTLGPCTGNTCILLLLNSRG